MSKHPILIAQISDLHIKAPGALAYGRVDTAVALSRCISELNRLSPRPDLVVISGDLADTPTAAEYEHLTTLLAPLQIPFAAIPGNHDDRALMRAALPQDGVPVGDPLKLLAGAATTALEVGRVGAQGVDRSRIEEPPEEFVSENHPLLELMGELQQRCTLAR